MCLPICASVSRGSSGFAHISGISQRGQATMRLRRSIPRTTASAAALTGWVFASGPRISPRSAPSAVWLPPRTISVSIQEK